MREGGAKWNSVAVYGSPVDSFALIPVFGMLCPQITQINADFIGVYPRSSFIDGLNRNARLTTPIKANSANRPHTAPVTNQDKDRG
jgi:hypothetical protein